MVSYLSARPTRDVISLARQEITRIWWQRKLPLYSGVISQLVLTDAAAGDKAAASERLKAVSALPLLAGSLEITRLAQRFVRPDCIPAKAKDDALHLALCAVYEVPYLLTWNFRHLANPDHRDKLRDLCLAAGYEWPAICTPDEMMKGEL